MKNYWMIALMLVATSLASCDNPGDSNTPEPQEMINIVRMTLHDSLNMQDSSIFEFVDLDGPAGSQAPIISGDTLVAGRTYIGRTELFQVFRDNGDSLKPLNPEIILSGTSHQLFYEPKEGLETGTNIHITDTDDNGKPLGFQFRLHVQSSMTAGSFKLNLVLSHFDDPSQKTGTIRSDESDVDIDFPVFVR